MSDLNFKSVTEVPTTETTEGLNLLANNNGIAVQIPIDKVGGDQADWNETDETSSAYIKNKPETTIYTTTIYTWKDDGYFYTADGVQITGAIVDADMKRGPVMLDLTGYEDNNNLYYSKTYAPILYYALDATNNSAYIRFRTFDGDNRIVNTLYRFPYQD